MEKTWFIKEQIEDIMALGKNPPCQIHGDPTPNQKFAYPTHTHGLVSSKIPEIFINAAAYGPQGNAQFINMAVAALILNKEYYREFMEHSFLEMKTGMFSAEEDMTFCLRKVTNDFLGVTKAYNDDAPSKYGYCQLYVKGDDHVLIEDYYKNIGNENRGCGPGCGVYRG